MLSPDRVLQSIKSLIPNDYYQEVERFQRRSVAAHGRPENQWCYFNALMDVAVTYFASDIMTARKIGNLEKVFTISAIPTLSLWRMTKGFYEFDQTLLDELLDADLRSIPISLLSNLPEYCVYIPLNGLRLFSHPVNGVFMHLAEFHAGVNGEGRKEFRVLTWREDGLLALHALDLISNDIMECIEASIKKVDEDWKMLQDGAEGPISATRSEKTDELMQSTVRDFSRCLSLALYLCSEKPDIAGEFMDPMAHSVSRSKKAKYSYRAPMQAHILQVGFKFGGAIRMWREQQQRPPSDTSGLGMPKAPHVRRGHFHVFLTGPGRRIPKVRWVHPILVNVRRDEMDDFPVTSRLVLDDPANAK